MKSFSPFAVVFLGVALLAGGCKDKPADDAASIQKSLEETGTVDVMDQVAKAPEFAPPAGARLSDAQMQMYLEVRGREQKIRQAAMEDLKETPKAAMGNLADLAIADLRAALELGYNPKEYQWVKDQVMEAETLQGQQALNVQVTRTQESLLALLDKEVRETSNEEELKRLNEQIRELRERAAQSPADMAPEKAANAELVGRYQNELKVLKAEDRRLTGELGGSGEGDGER
jgi:hypothetical protein